MSTTHATPASRPLGPEERRLLCRHCQDHGLGHGNHEECCHCSGEGRRNLHGVSVEPREFVRAILENVAAFCGEEISHPEFHDRQRRLWILVRESGYEFEYEVLRILREENR